jgi:hypothetical protein
MSFHYKISLDNLKIYIGFILMAFLYSCASQGNISGGPKDTKPPALIVEKSNPSMTLNTTLRKFEFTFDEFVEIKEVLKEVLVSPPLTYLPKVVSRGKKIEFSFNEKEILKENTTYIINFGESIRDFNEGNKLSNFKHVFSTGDQIDSLKVEGKVFDFETKKDLGGIIVMLYEDLNDSTIIKKKPFYSTKTDAKGAYFLENIKKSKFRIIALKDENSNLIFNEGTEGLGFTDKYVEWDSSIVYKQDLYVSVPELKPRIIGSKNDKYGITKVKINTKLNKNPTYKLSEKFDFSALSMKDDSIMLHYYSNEKLDSFNWMLPFDTITIYTKDLIYPKLAIKATPMFNTIGHLPQDSLKFEFNSTVDAIDKSKVILKDSFNNIAVDIVKTAFNTIAISNKLISKRDYQYTILPGAVIDYFGNKNDTIIGKVNIFDTSILSTMNVELSGLDSTLQYEVILLKSGQKMSQETVVGKSKILLKYKNLKSDEYSLNVLEDKNKNGVKDGSNYWKKTQSETQKIFKLEKLRESWNLETKVNYENNNLLNQNNTKDK